MQAIILAAGMGRRLGEYTSDNTKCMLPVNGVRLIDRMLGQLRRLPLNRIVVVVGYEGEKLRHHIDENHHDLNIQYVENSIYDRTNNIWSLWLAKEYFEADDTLLLESDLILDDSILTLALESEYDNVALVSKYETWMDGTMVKIDEDNNILNFITKKAFRYSDTDQYYKTVNVYKFTKEFIRNHYIPFLDAYIKVLGENEYYEQVLRVLTMTDKSDLKALPITGKHWYEIDDVQDLRIAETIFAEPELRLEKIQKSYGGYWRYSNIVDFCYLVNPYFPKSRMIDEMKANFEVLLREYPSGMEVNSLLAGKYFGVKTSYICVGNGAAELIKSLMESFSGKVGVVLPTFEEYPNRLDKDKVVYFYPDNSNYSYSATDLIDFYSDKAIDALLVVNPDNPSGNFISMNQLGELIKWSVAKGIRLVIDESFVDFTEGGNGNTLLKNEILESTPTLCVVKSISKSYGVPGLRLGVIASGDTELIAHLKKDVSIWNINSFGEFYMQIFNKYERDYNESCELFRRERDLFYKDLSAVPYLRVIPSQANYFLCEVTDRFSSYELTLKLLTEYDMLIKDCSHKKGFDASRQYVRIAIRDRKDNARLCEVLLSL